MGDRKDLGQRARSARVSPEVRTRHENGSAVFRTVWHRAVEIRCTRRPHDPKLHVWSDGGDCDKYVAHDAADAHALQLETLGENCAELDDWHQLPDDKVITIDFEDEAVHGFTGKVKKTCGEWAAAIGRGFLCSSEF